MCLNGFVHIVRATGQIAALPPDQAGEGELVEADQEMRALLRERARGLMLWPMCQT